MLRQYVTEKGARKINKADAKALIAFGKFPNIQRGPGYMWGPNLAKRKDFTEITSQFTSKEDIRKKAPPGAIIVYARGPGATDIRRNNGHVEVALGGGKFYFGKILDYPGGSVPNFDMKKPGNVRVFMPGSPIDSANFSRNVKSVGGAVEKGTGKYIDFNALESSAANLDFKPFASKYPGEAALKNNNPAGITYSKSYVEGLNRDGIKCGIGTARPAKEGLNYVGFPNMGEGLKAYNRLWKSKLGKFANKPFSAFASNWAVDTRSYQKRFGDIWNKTVGSLTPEEINRIKAGQMQIESPGTFKELSKVA